jgi:hypothetical protein
VVLGLGGGGVIAIAPTSPSPAIADDATPITITPNPWYANEPFEGWGTSLVWFANATGGYPAELRERFYQLVFGEDGLDLNIARFNVGGENSNDTTPYLRAGGALDGYWANDTDGAAGTYGGVTTTFADRAALQAVWDPDNPAHYDWSKDSTQRWWIERLAQDDQITHWEAFSNSAPYFMTVNGYVSGRGSNDNLLAAAADQFAGYMLNVTNHLEDQYGIEFHTIEPFNEPTLGWGSASGPGGRQEGMHLAPAAQVPVLRALATRMAADPTDPTIISSPDDTNPQAMTNTWNAYPSDVKEAVGQLNTHTYGTAGRLGARDASKASDTRLWMSEIEGN